MDRTSSSRHCPTASPPHVIVTSDLPWQPIGQQKGGWGMGRGRVCPSRPLTKYRNGPEEEAQGGKDGGDMPGGGGKVPNCPRKVPVAIFTYPSPRGNGHMLDGLREGGGID